MRFESTYPKKLVCENQEDCDFIMNALELVKTQYGEGARDKAQLIIDWFNKN